MTTDSKKQVLKTIRERKYLNRDFSSFRNDLNEYAKTYFSDKIQGLGPNTLGGIFMDLAAYIGDVQSFYLDHQFHELNPETAVEVQNIERLLKDNGVEIVGASPAVVEISFTIKVPAVTSSGVPVPNDVCLPIIYAGTTVKASNGVVFELTEDVDFNEIGVDGNYKASLEATGISNGNPSAFYMTLGGICLSGQRAVDSFNVVGFESFKKCVLSKENVTEIISVSDTEGKVYYEVKYLTQDTVFKGILNRNEDAELVEENLQITPAPYRFIKQASLQTGLTTLTFGGGSAETLDDDMVPDPSEFALPLYGKSNFSRFSFSPGNLLRTSTLGIVTPNTTLSVVYRYGGGLSHNIEEGSIRGIETLRINFPNGPSVSEASLVRQSLDARNLSRASGGDDAPSLDDLKLRIPAARNAQSRIVTKEDLLAMVYTMPANFGRVFKASIRSNPVNPNAASLYIICRDASNQLVIAPDALKLNLSKFLNQYRIISDAIDILDVRIINLSIEYSIVIEPNYNRQIILQNINAKLQDYFNIKNFEVDQPIVTSDIQNIIYNNIGVISVQSIKIDNKIGTEGSLTYSSVYFNVSSNTFNGIIVPTSGGMFEIKYKDRDITGICIS